MKQLYFRKVPVHYFESPFEDRTKFPESDRTEFPEPADGARLSIEDTARRIHAQSGMPLDSIESHVVGWLEMTYEPQGLNEYQMEEFELLIEQWITPYDDPL
jgi:hypothetical protein